MNTAHRASAHIELKGEEEANPAEIVTKAIGDLSTTIDARFVQIEKKAAELETALRRPITGTANDNVDGAEEIKAFNAYLRTGRADEIKTLQVGSGTGGILAPEAHSNSVIEKIIEHSPVRGLAQSITMAGGMLKFPRLVDEVEPAPVTELGTRAEDEPTFEEISLEPFEMSVIVPVSRVLLEDSAVNLSAFLASHLGKKFGQKEATWFINGNGTTAAQGLLTNTEIVAHTSADTVLDADDLIDTFYKIKSAYSSRGSWLMSRATMAVVRKLKDTDGAYLWTPGIAGSQAPTLLGRPVYEAPDMVAPAAGATVALFGDFAEGYMIADRVGIELDQDRHTGWANGIVKVLARRRVGGRVILPEAITKLTLAAS